MSPTTTSNSSKMLSSKPINGTRQHMYSTLHASPVLAKQQPATNATIPDDDLSEPVPNSDPTYSYDFFVYAAWHPKNRSAKQHRAKMKIPYWKQKQVGNVDAGEDAFFQTCTPGGLALGVADGVGGWSEVGVDPALFSWTLMNNAASAAKSEKQLDAHHILDKAFDRLVQDGKVQAGSSTACILNMCKATGKMTTCNLGDSAFLLIRDQKVVYESPSQQHYFNCPYQLTVVPQNYPDRELYVTDMPKDGDKKSFFLKDGDVIVLATDGYFDNVYSHETLAMVNKELEQLSENDDDESMLALVRRLSKSLTDTAKRLSLDPKRLSPWAKGAQAHGSNYTGGKVDDIVCLVTLVRQGHT
ncbi:protein serine/threonine phosphatase 2C [Hesseltinella vesiculosa]|uniref:Protein phosphatase n=1 Tax=Hesseltinella vesiculosa TaxID=101127 RepID=A0A1X2GCU7_9FUNG|nr:protein serine/threonine phosphatase 2C [Hesseltinella vesiculosa]